MPSYTFQTLSHIDFENLVRDLLQSELSIRLESFKTGKDLGIDLRYSKCNAQPLIVQAKHYAGTGFRALLSHLKRKEKAKIDRLQPARYLLATSIPLSPANKDTLRKALSPHVKGSEDIYGREDLNNLLGLFPEIERQHFKLWLSSTTVLEEVLHSRILNQTRITLQDIRDNARLYVANESYNRALEVLKDYNYVIVAGIPGIGKTILAKMLVLRFLRANYDFIDVSYDISEAYSIPDHKRPRVYLYDDFLGRTSIEEKLRKNEDNRLIDFIASVRKTKSAKLILTTREYILRQAQATYEILNSPVFDKPQCIVDLSQYTRPIRAQILYNHLYFSQLPRKHVEEIVRQATYLKIVDHPNYNPRIVEYMTDPMWVGSSQPRKYPAVFLHNLQEPFLIWEQAFHNQLTSAAREILLVLGTLPREVFVEDLERAAKSFLPREGVALSAREFRRALSELQGNFIVLRRDKENDIVAFHNPSVKDFVESYLDKNPGLYAALLQTACFFEQVHWICERFAKSGRVKGLQQELLVAVQNTLSSAPCILINYSSDRGRSTYKDREPLRNGARLAFIASLLGKAEFSFMSSFFRKALNELTKKMPDLHLSNNDVFLLTEEVSVVEGIDDLANAFFAAAKESLFRNAYWVSDVSHITDLMELHPQLFTTDDRERIIETVRNIVDNHLDDDYAQLLSDELSTVENMERRYNFGLHEQVERVRELLSSAEENYPPEDDYDDDRYSGGSGGESISNDALADIFSTLLR
jgi:hypothetical protein